MKIDLKKTKDKINVKRLAVLKCTGHVPTQAFLYDKTDL